MRCLRDSSASLWLPDILVPAVAQIDFVRLKQKGIRQCFIDIDGTLTERGRCHVSTATLQNLQHADMPVYIATNRLDTAGLTELAAAIGAAGFVTPENWRGKPSRTYYMRALSRYGFKARQTIMIGDRLLQDVWGAHRAGLPALFITERFDGQNSRIEHLLDRWQRWYVRRHSSEYTNN